MNYAADVELVVKNEINPIHTIAAPLSGAIKQEAASSVAESAIEFAANLPLWNKTAACGSDVTTTQLPQASELLQSFVIYEFETEANATTPVAQQAPKLLNGGLRKRSRPTVAATSPQPLPAVRKRQVSCVSQKPRTTTTEAVSCASPSAAPAELRVKCFCRLGNREEPVVESNSDQELKRFFERMCNETYLLGRAEQREVKMALLQAVCQAEADVEAGMCCEKCCT